MKEELLLLRNQLKMGHRISFAEAMLLQRAIDILVNNAGNSPVIDIDPASDPDRTVEVRYVAPPGYVMVPKEPTEEMLQASYREAAVYSPTAYRAMIAAAPQSPGSEPATVPGKWIPVSERMPEDRTQVILWDAEIGEVTSGHYSHKTHTFYHCGDAIENEITHWMPTPAAPQEMKGE
ncbi:DUF551 domain-containing protein [Klebsiella pneumoniae]|nr:DUF551 domain-containing protein [Klebsiella variicola]